MTALSWPAPANPDQRPDPRQAVNGPAGPAPVRTAGSIRRTATIDMTWPDGRRGPLRLEGRARDAVTRRADEPPAVVATASAITTIDDQRTITAIDVSPRRPDVERLVGCRGGGHLRAALDDVLPGEREAGTPLYLLLDDLSGTSLIAGVAWTQQPADRPPRPTGPDPASMESVCIGFRPGATSLVELGRVDRAIRAPVVGPLVRADDPDGWHPLADLPAVFTRRARFIDVAFDGDEVVSVSGFQDTTAAPGRGPIAIHEYRLRVAADRATMTVRSVEPDPRVLPFRECPAAVDTARDLIGVPLASLRRAVLERLARTNGCTHLNDALRALAEVPVLAAALETMLGDDPGD